MARKPISRRKVLKWGASAVFGGLFHEAFTEVDRIESIKKLVLINHLPWAFHGFKIGVISDIHWGHNIDHEFLDRACRMVMAYEPDLIVIPGDFYHGQGETMRKPPDFAHALDVLHAPHGLFGVLGNHDHQVGKDFVTKQIAAHTSLQLIDNTGLYIEKGGARIALGGVGDLWKDEVDLHKAFQKVPGDIPRILLSHNPDIAEEVEGDAYTRVDFQISGHSHGGQMVIPGVYNPYRHFSKYGAKFNRGLVQGNRQPVFVSKGIARLNHMRFCAPPDVACITLIRAT